MGLFSRTQGATHAERRANIQALRNADAALNANTDAERRAGIHDETPAYTALNTAANQAAAKVSRWRGGTR